MLQSFPNQIAIKNIKSMISEHFKTSISENSSSVHLNFECLQKILLYTILVYVITSIITDNDHLRRMQGARILL